MPAGLHAALAHESEQKGTSLNAFITATLAVAVGWDGASVARRKGKSAPQAPSAESAPRRRAVERLLVANLVVVAAVGLLAIVLLVRALR